MINSVDIEKVYDKAKGLRKEYIYQQSSANLIVMGTF